MAESVGVKEALNVCVPALGVVPLAGLYVKEPATLAVALSCVVESAVPNVIPFGVAHVRVGVALPTTRVAVPVTGL